MLGSGLSPRARGIGSGAPRPTRRVGSLRDADSIARAAATVLFPTPPWGFQTPMARHPAMSIPRPWNLAKMDDGAPLVLAFLEASTASYILPTSSTKLASSGATSFTQATPRTASTASCPTPWGSRTKQTPGNAPRTSANCSGPSKTVPSASIASGWSASFALTSSGEVPTPTTRNLPSPRSAA